MKALIILLFSVTALAKVTIDLPEEKIYGQPKEFNSSCQLFGLETKKAVVNRYLKASDSLNALTDKYHNLTAKHDALMKKNIFAEAQVEKNGKVCFTPDQIIKANKLMFIAHNKVRKLQNEYSKINKQSKNAFELLLRTAVKGNPSLYGLERVTDSMEKALKDGLHQKVLKLVNVRIRVLEKELKRIKDCLSNKNKRVGISQNIQQRKAHWLRKYPNLYNWTLVQCGLTYRQAQDLENTYLAKGYDGHPGGLKKIGKGYCVYTFNY